MKRIDSALALLACLLIAATAKASPLQAADWNQWRGPSRDGQPLPCGIAAGFMV